MEEQEQEDNNKTKTSGLENVSRKDWNGDIGPDNSKARPYFILCFLCSSSSVTTKLCHESLRDSMCGLPYFIYVSRVLSTCCQDSAYSVSDGTHCVPRSAGSSVRAWCHITSAKLVFCVGR